MGEQQLLGMIAALPADDRVLLEPLARWVETVTEHLEQISMAVGLLNRLDDLRAREVAELRAQLGTRTVASSWRTEAAEVAVVIDLEADTGPMPLGVYERTDEDTVIYTRPAGDHGYAPADCVAVVSLPLAAAGIAPAATGDVCTLCGEWIPAGEVDRDEHGNPMHAMCLAGARRVAARAAERGERDA